MIFVRRNNRIDQLLLIIKSQVGIINGIRSDLEHSIPLWKISTSKMLDGVLSDDYLSVFNGIKAESWAREKELYVNFMNELKRGAEISPDVLLKGEEKSVNNVDLNNFPPLVGGVGKVFVVHGHDELAKIELARFLERIKLIPVILHEQPNEGKTIIEKFERDANNVDYAVVLMTPDDYGYKKDRPAELMARARQNVVFELGFFSGVLGRKKICVLLKGGVEVPSDYMGVVCIGMDAAGAWKMALAREIMGSGISVNPIDMF